MSMSVRSRAVAARVRWYEFTPEVLVGVGLGVFALTEPHAARSGLNSAKAIALMAIVAIVWIAARTFAFAVIGRRLLRALPFVVGALAILEVVVLPAYDNHTVIETLTAAGPPAGVTGTATPTQAAPVRIRRAAFAGIDHRATGTVNVYRRASGAFIVGLEHFDIQPGPAYALYIVPGSERRDHDNGTRIERLRGNRGTQFYDVHGSIDLSSGEWTVLVWCETFDVPVAHATPVV